VNAMPNPSSVVGALATTPLPPGILLEVTSGPDYDADLLAITQEVNKKYIEQVKKYQLWQKAAAMGPGVHVAIVTGPEGLHLAYCQRLPLATLTPAVRIRTLEIMEGLLAATGAQPSVSH
jgi:hypothetical protein